jgi:hypothetical protein
MVLHAATHVDYPSVYAITIAYYGNLIQFIISH